MVACDTRATIERAMGADIRRVKKSDSAVRQAARWTTLIACGTASCEPPNHMSCMAMTMTTMEEWSR